MALPDYHLEHQAAVDYYAIQYPYLVHHHHSSTTILSLAVVNCCLAFTIVVVKSSDANKPNLIVSPFVIIHRPIFVTWTGRGGLYFSRVEICCENPTLVLTFNNQPMYSFSHFEEPEPYAYRPLSPVTRYREWLKLIYNRDIAKPASLILTALTKSRIEIEYRL